MEHPYLTAEEIEEYKKLQGNFTVTPTYIDLLVGIWHAVSWYYKPKMWRDYSFPRSFTDDFVNRFYFPLAQVYYIIYIAVFITVLRYLFERFVCKPLVNWFNLKSINKKKFPESAWKWLFYTMTWSYSVYLLFFRYNYFREFYLIWDDWSPRMPIPFDIQVMYFVQCGFYLHSVYGTLYMDYKRKDFYAMLLHHVLTTVLILVSYATRYHKIGLLVMFVHDITDVWLELTKVFHYLTERADGRTYPFWDYAANVCFIVFTFSWFLFRLYWYPMKVLYGAGVVAAYRAYEKGCGLYGFFNTLLWMLLGLNLYWLFFILQFLFRICRGSLSNLHDVREDDEDDDDDDIDDKLIKSTSTVNNVGTSDRSKKKK